MSSDRSHRLAALLTLAALSVAAPARAQVPPTMTYEGYLEDAGAPFSGNVDVDFALYASESGGSALWSESHAGVSVAAGAFVVQLGEVTPLGPGYFAATAPWLEVVVDGDTLSPRTPLGALPYAYRASLCNEATRLIGFTPADYSSTAELGASLASPGGLEVHWQNLQSVPADLADGDAVLSEAQVETYVTNGALDLASGTTLGGQSIATGPHSSYTAGPGLVLNGSSFDLATPRFGYGGVADGTYSQGNWAGVRFRITGGASASSGRLEVTFDSGATWGTVCDDGFTDDAADVLCRSLGYTSGVMLSSADTPDGSGTILLDDMQCPPRARSVFECRINVRGQNNCGHFEDVGITCSP